MVTTYFTTCFSEDEIFEQFAESILNTTTSLVTAVVLGWRYVSDKNAVADEWSLRTLLIGSNPEICSGRPTILATRVAVSDIVELHHLLRWDLQRILDEYPYLNEEEVIAALEYYERHTEEIDKYIMEEKEINGQLQNPPLLSQ